MCVCPIGSLTAQAKVHYVGGSPAFVLTPKPNHQPQTPFDSSLESKNHKNENKSPVVDLIFVNTFLPVEDHPTHSIISTPLTLVLILGMVLVFILGQRHQLNLFLNWGFVPVLPFREFGATFISAAVLHSGWLHLLGNMYFLFLLGDDIENELGVKSYILFLLVACIGAGIGAMYFSGKPGIPHVGFSGVLNALLMFYALQFPKSKFRWWFRILPNQYSFLSPGSVYDSGNYLSIATPAYSAIGVFLLKDFVMWKYFETGGVTSTAFSMHLGGAFTGLLVWAWVSSGARSSPRGASASDA